MLQILIAALTLVGAHAGTEKMDLGKESSKLMAAKKDYKKEVFGAEELKKWPHTIQVAAYLSEDDAVEHVKELRGTEKNAFYYSTYVRGQVWYKVCVGRYKTAKAAASYQREFIKKHDEPFSVVISLNKGITTGSEKKMRVASTKKLAPTKMRRPASTPKAKPKFVHSAKKHTPKKMAKATTAMSTATTAKAVNKYYSLQVAAFSKSTEAQKHLDGFKKQGHNGKVVEAFVKGQTWYRVVLGNFTSYSEANNFKDSFQRTNNVQGLVRKFTN